MIVLLKFIMWVIFLIALFRARDKFLRNDDSTRLIWLLFLLWCVAVTLWGDETEILWNERLSGLVIFVKSGCMLLTFYLYYLLLKPMRPSAMYRFLDVFAPMVCVFGVVWFLFASSSIMTNYLDRRFLVIGVRDFVMAVYVVLIFLPYTLSMIRGEKHAPMRVKQSAALICFTGYLMIAVSSVIAGLATRVGMENTEAIAKASDPIIPIGIIAFIVTMIPYRWLILMFQIRR